MKWEDWMEQAKALKQEYQKALAVARTADREREAELSPSTTTNLGKTKVSLPSPGTEGDVINRFREGPIETLLDQLRPNIWQWKEHLSALAPDAIEANFPEPMRLPFLETIVPLITLQQSLIAMAVGLLFDKFGSTPFQPDYDVLLEQLAFNREDMTRPNVLVAWEAFLDREFEGYGPLDEWPIEWGIAEWYEERDMFLRAAAVYEHLRTKHLGRNDVSEFEDVGWLRALVRLYYRSEEWADLLRSIQLLQDYARRSPGAVDVEECDNLEIMKAEARQHLYAQRLEDIRFVAKINLETDLGEVWEKLHPETRAVLTAARAIHKDPILRDPGLVALELWRAIESEWTAKLNHFYPKRDYQDELREQKCTLSQQITDGPHTSFVKRFVNMCSDPDFLQFQTTRHPLSLLKWLRNNHVHSGPDVSPDELQEIWDRLWTNDFLKRYFAALQPRH